MRKTTLAVVFSLTIAAKAQCPAESTLFFGNGMFNSKQTARQSLNQLKSRIDETENWKRERSYLAYNHDESAVYQLLEVFEQKTDDFDKRFWRWMWDWTDAPKWFQDTIKAQQTKQDINGLQGHALSEQHLRYQDEMEVGRSIVVVAHSQGNFFANNSSLWLQNAFYPASTDFRIISVATPASFVEDDGPYFTLESDGVIRWIPGALPPNAANTAPKPSLFDHRFVDHYLDGLPTGTKIVETVQAIFKRLAEQAKKNEGYNADCWKWFESLNLPKNDTEACVMKCGTAMKDFSIFMCNQCEAYCKCWHKKQMAEIPFDTNEGLPAELAGGSSELEHCPTAVRTAFRVVEAARIGTIHSSYLKSLGNLSKPQVVAPHRKLYLIWLDFFRLTSRADF